MRPADVMRADIRARMEAEGLVFTWPAGEEPETFFVLAAGWLFAALQKAEARLAAFEALQENGMTIKNHDS